MDFSTWTPNSLLYTILFLPNVFLLAIILNRLLSLPLKHIPGPSLWRISRTSYAYNVVRGQLPSAFSSLHERYGPIVRVVYNKILFITEET